MCLKPHSDPRYFQDKNVENNIIYDLMHFMYAKQSTLFYDILHSPYGRAFRVGGIFVVHLLSNA